MDCFQGIEVHRKCMTIANYTFSDRSFRDWKRLCRITPKTPRQGDWLTTFEVKKLLTLAFLRRTKPRGHFNIGIILLEMSKPDKQQWLEAVAIAPVATLIEPCYGRELGKRIYQLTGVYFCERKLYRLGEKYKTKLGKFHRDTYYSSAQINRWIDIAVPKFEEQQEVNAA